MRAKSLTIAVIVLFIGLVPFGTVSEAQPQGEELVAHIGTEAIQTYRDQMNQIANTYFELASVRQNRRAQLMAAEFVVRAEQLTDEELAMFMAAGADLEALLRAVKNLNQQVTESQPFLDSSDRLGSQEPSNKPSTPSFDGTFPSAPYSGTCGSTRNDTATVFIAQIALQVARGVWSALSRACNQVVVICPAPGGGNTSAACIAADTALFAAEAVLEDFIFCDNDINSAEIEGSYDRLGHIHDNLDAHNTNIDTDLAAHDTNIDTDLAAHDTNIDTDLAAHDTNIDADLAAHDANIDGDLVAHNTNLNAHNLNIETRLAAHDLNIDTDLQTHDADIKSLTGTIQDTLDNEIELRRVHLQVLEIPNQKKYLVVATEGGQPVDVDFLGMQVFDVNAVNFATLAGASLTNVEQGIYLMEVDLHALGPDRIFRIQVRHNDIVDHFGELLFRRTGDSPQSPTHPPRTR